MFAALLDVMGKKSKASYHTSVITMNLRSEDNAHTLLACGARQRTTSKALAWVLERLLANIILWVSPIYQGLHYEAHQAMLQRCPHGPSQPLSSTDGQLALPEQARSTS